MRRRADGAGLLCRAVYTNGQRCNELHGMNKDGRCPMHAIVNGLYAEFPVSRAPDLPRPAETTKRASCSFMSGGRQCTMPRAAGRTVCGMHLEDKRFECAEEGCVDRAMSDSIFCPLHVETCGCIAAPGAVPWQRRCLTRFGRCARHTPAQNTPIAPPPPTARRRPSYPSSRPPPSRRMSYPVARLSPPPSSSVVGPPPVAVTRSAPHPNRGRV